MNKKYPNKEYKMKVGDNILSWRKLKGIKQEELAKKIGISTTALSNIENGISKPDIERLEDIADALEIEVNQLLLNPQQIFSEKNKVENKAGANHVDKDLLDRVMAVMEKITHYFTNNNQKTTN
jgi:transcriptional regulator with XRE-family HTH domain